MVGGHHSSTSSTVSSDLLNHLVSALDCLDLEADTQRERIRLFPGSLSQRVAERSCRNSWGSNKLLLDKNS